MDDRRLRAEEEMLKERQEAMDPRDFREWEADKPLPLKSGLSAEEA